MNYTTFIFCNSCYNLIYFAKSSLGQLLICKLQLSLLIFLIVIKLFLQQFQIIRLLNNTF